MLRQRLLYGLLLLAGAVFYLFSPGYLSFYLLVVLILLPFLSLALTLPGLAGLDFDLRAQTPYLDRGGTLRTVFSARSKWGKPRLDLTWQAENLLYPQLTETGKGALDADGSFTLELPAPHCGWARITAKRCVLRDWMGVWSIPVKAPAPLAVLVRPLPDSSLLPDLSEPLAGARLVPRPGGGPGEEYDLRSYRPGDPVNAIHWKLTAKRPDDQDPVLRETMDPLLETVVITYDHFGSPDEVDRSLGRLAVLAERLLEKERTFYLARVDGDALPSGWYAIHCRPDWDKSLRDLCAHPAPPTPPEGAAEPPLPSVNGPIRRVHVSGKEQEAGL